MRNTQLDSSLPRPGNRTGGAPGAADAPVAYRYLPPILATGASAILLTLFFGVLALTVADITLGLLEPPADAPASSLFVTGGCGLLTILLVGAAAYFFVAAFTAARDLAIPPVTHLGRLRTKHLGRGRGGGHWIVVGPDAPAPAPSDRPAAPSLVAAGTGERGPATRVPAERGFARNTAGTLGAQLRGVQVGARPSDPAGEKDPPLPDQWRRLAPDEINLRIGKDIYEALAAGDRVEVVYSRHLQHVYYVRRYADSGPVVLLNRMLI